MCDATKQEWVREYDIQQKRACNAEAENDRLRAALEELVNLMEGVRSGEYTPDSFTCQPAREVLGIEVMSKSMQKRLKIQRGEGE